MLEDFYHNGKIQRLRPGFNPRTRIPEASMLTNRPSEPSLISLSLSRNSLPFEEPDGSLHISQQPITAPDPKSNYHVNNIQPFLINSYIVRVNYPTGSLPEENNVYNTRGKDTKILLLLIFFCVPLMEYMKNSSWVLVVVLSHRTQILDLCVSILRLW
jgi:hypothetical protein